MSRYEAVRGLRLEAVANVWAAYSPASGETHLLNDECAAILEVLVAGGTLGSTEVAQALSDDVDVAQDELAQTVELAWSQLQQAGLVRRRP